MDRTKFFSEQRSSKDKMWLYFGDWPFAVSIYCEMRLDGYTTDWIVTGVRKSDDSPRFLIRLQMGVNAKREDLYDTCLAIWNEQLEELAFHAAIQGGQDLPTNSIPKSLQNSTAEWHLFAHERYGNFDSEEGTLTKRTANLFNLLKSLGYIQAQKLITEFEMKEADSPIKPATISRRLHMARQAGLIPHLIDMSEWTYPDDFEE